jgi:hypothetical protein
MEDDDTLSMPCRRVVVLGEDYDRTLPLLRALDERGVHVQFWNTARGALVPTVRPENAVYFSRQSPSAGAREHALSIPYVRSVLSWLDAHGCTVINGIRAFDVEMSKAAQIRILHAASINTPATTLVSTGVQAWAELARIDAPVILKPDTGGSGGGVAAYVSGAAAAATVRSAPAGTYDACPWIIQEHLGKYSTDETQVRSVLRFEIVDGKVLYVMQIRAPPTEFKLCPCDPRAHALLSRIDFKIIADPMTIPCWAAANPSEPRAAWIAFCMKLEAVWASLGARVGSAEAFLPTLYLEDGAERAYSPQARLHPHEPVVFELNFNSNYNEGAEYAAGVSGINAVADMLTQLATENT